MTGALPDNQITQVQPNRLSQVKKLYILGTLAIILIGSHLPLGVGRLVLIDGGISKNDLWLFLILPFLTCFLMLVCPILTAKIGPELVGFHIIWIRKKRSEVAWILLLLLIALISCAIIRLLMEHLGIPISGAIIFLSDNTIFLITYTFLIAFVAPVVEEVFWRGFIQSLLSKAFGAWIALFAQAIVFAAVHFRPVGGFFGVLAIGLILGLWRCKRKTLLPIIFAHIIINSLWCVQFWCNRAELAKINIKTDYVAQFNEVSRPANYDPNDNAVGHYKKAFQLSVNQPEELTKSDIKDWPADLPDEKQIMLQDWVCANSEALEQLELGAQRSYYWHEYQGCSMYDIIPTEDFGKSKNLAYAISLRAKLKAAKGNFKEASSDILICCRFGEHFTGPKTLLEQLFGIAIRARASDTAFQILDRTKPNLELLADFQQQLQTFSSEKRFVINFAFEKLLFYDNIQRMFTDDGEGGGYIPRNSIEQMRNPPPALRILSLVYSKEQASDWAKLERRQTVELTDRAFEYLNLVRQKTPVQLHNDGENLQEVIEEMTDANPFVLMLIPAFEQILQISYRRKIAIEALTTSIALMRYKIENGVFPAILQELVLAGYLKSLPMDPYSDGSLVYKRIGDDFILYSFAADFDDDGGTRSNWGIDEKGGDQVFWPVERYNPYPSLKDTHVE